MGRTGDHSVGQAEVHHHRAEVGRVCDRVRGLVDGDSLVCPEARIFLGELETEHIVERADDVGARQVEPEGDRARAHLEGFAEDRQPRDAARQEGRGRSEDAVVVALGKDDVLVRRTRPLEQVVLEHQRGDHVRAADVESFKQFEAVDTPLEQRERRVVLALRIGSETAARVRDANRRLVRAQVGGDDRERRSESVDETGDRLRQVESAVQHDAGDRGEGARRVGHEHCEERLEAIARDDDDGAFDQAWKYVDHGHAGDDDPERFACEQLFVARDERPVDGLEDGAHARSDEIGVFRDGPDHRLVRYSGAHGGGDLALVVRIRPVHDHGEERRVLHLQFRLGDLCQLAQIVCRAGLRLTEPLAEPLADTPAEHEEHRGAQVGRDARVVAELGRAAHVGEVGADHHDGVAARLDGMEPLDDGRERRITIGVHVVVGDPDALFVVDRGRHAPEEQFQDVVPLDCRACDRPEDSDPPDRTGQELENAEGDRRFAGVPLCRRDVDGVGHLYNLPSGAKPWGVLHRNEVSSPETKETPHAPARAGLPLLRFRPGGVGLDGAT